MRTLCFMNAKGGVAKTVSTVNVAAILAKFYGKHVLVLDCDSQGDTTAAFYHGSTNSILTLTDVFERNDIKLHDAIVHTEYDNIDLLPSNNSLLGAEKHILTDDSSPQQTHLKNALLTVDKDYDYCVIDCPPGVGMCAINAITASNDVLVPIKFDRYSMKGLNFIDNTIEELKAFNTSLEFRGCFITQYSRNNLHTSGEEALKKMLSDKLLNTHIRQSVKVSESTFTQPLIYSSPKSNPTQDYISLVKEYFDLIKK